MTRTTSEPNTPRPVTYQELEALFRPQSIAVVGASANERNRGHGFVKDLVDFGFPGPIYPVNPRLDEMLGLKADPRLEDIPGPVGLRHLCGPRQCHPRAGGGGQGEGDQAPPPVYGALQ